MVLTKLCWEYGTVKSPPLNVAGFMSGSGTNLVKILEHERELKLKRGKSPFHVAVIFSDTHKSKASEIGANFGVPVFIYDMVSFFEKRGKPLKDMETRAEYEKECVKVLDAFECEVAAYAGYMRKATDVFVSSFLGVNVHPADLTLKAEDGRPKYRGDHVVKDAIKAGERTIRSSTHLVTEKVDCGPVLMVSSPLAIDYPIPEDKIDEMAGHYQNALKERGDWVIFPRTLEYLADGRFAQDENKMMHFNGEPIPDGVRLG
jgi:folate-dependent phosphoribosylglycinamide formyltransferase PurN